MIYLDSNFQVMTGQVVECLECRDFWPYIIAGFIYNDIAGGWRQDPGAKHVTGYCKDCARVLNDLNQQDYSNGNWNTRDMEDERYAR